MSLLCLSPYLSSFITFYAFYFAVKRRLHEDYVRLSVLLSPSISFQFFHNLIKFGLVIAYKILLSKREHPENFLSGTHT